MLFTNLNVQSTAAVSETQNYEGSMQPNSKHEYFYPKLVKFCTTQRARYVLVENGARYVLGEMSAADVEDKTTW